jgi:hypothetical protein
MDSLPFLPTYFLRGYYSFSKAKIPVIEIMRGGAGLELNRLSLSSIKAEPLFKDRGDQIIDGRMLVSEHYGV